MNVAETGLGHKQVLVGGGVSDIYPKCTDASIQKTAAFWIGEVESAKSGCPLPLLVWLIIGVPVNLEVMTPVIYREEAVLSLLCHSIHALLPCVSIFTADRQKSLWYASFVVTFNLSDFEETLVRLTVRLADMLGCWFGIGSIYSSHNISYREFNFCLVFGQICHAEQTF